MKTTTLARKRSTMAIVKTTGEAIFGHCSQQSIYLIHCLDEQDAL